MERRRRDEVKAAANLPTLRDVAIGFGLALVGATIAGLATERLPIATIPLLIASGFSVGLLTERAWPAAVAGAVIGLPLGRDVLLAMFLQISGSFDRDGPGAIIFALFFVLPGWLLGRAVFLSRHQVTRARRSPSAYAVTGIGILAAVGAFALWLLSLMSREY